MWMSHLLHVMLTCILFGSRFASSAAFFTPPPRIAKANPLLVDLEKLVQQSESGLSQELETRIKSLMTDISKSRKGDQRKSLPGQWQLIFTTEKEVNFFKTSWPFADVRGITQGIDPYTTCKLENLISFEGGGEFAVTGTVSPCDSESEYDRVEFEFDNAVARGWGRELKLPPVGSGWFDTMFCDSQYRLSRDNRGDWSVFKKC